MTVLTRVLVLAAWRLRAAVGSRTLVAPAAALAAVELVVLSGDGPPAAVALTTAVAFALPVLCWAGRQVVDADPDDQQALAVLAVGGRRRAEVAGVLAACGVTVPVALLCAALSLLRVDEAGVPLGVAAAGALFACAAGLVAATVGVAASRAVVGAGGASVVVLVAAPVAFAVAGLLDSPVVSLLVPRLDEAVRAAYADRFPADAPAASVQAALWATALLGLRVVSRRT